MCGKGRDMARRDTKGMFAEELEAMMTRMPLSKVRVADLCASCGVERRVFYYHFKDKYDLIVWIYIHESGEIMSKIGVDGYSWRDTLLDGTRYFAANREDIINALRHTSGHDSFMLYVQKVNSDLMLTEVRKKLMTEYIPDEIYGMIKVYVYGTVHHMLEWLMNDKDLSPEKVAEIWEHSLPEPLTQYLYDP